VGGIGRVVQHQQHPLFGHALAPQPGPSIQTGRDPLGGNSVGLQQDLQGRCWVHRVLTGGVRAQVDELLPIGKAGRELVGGMHGERGLADPGHALHRVNRHRPHSAGRCGVHRGQQALEFVAPADKPDDIRRQRPVGLRWRQPRYHRR
jgi:hypothetical protein